MTPDPWGRLIAGVIPPGQSLDTTNKYMQLVQKMHVGHEIQMGTADDGTTVLFYYADAKPSPDVIVEETNPNLTMEVGFGQKFVPVKGLVPTCANCGEFIEEDHENGWRHVDSELAGCGLPFRDQEVYAELGPEVEFDTGEYEQQEEQGVFRQDFTEKDEAILGLASLMIPILDGWDAANYVTSTIMHGDEKFAVTVQRVGGMTPAEKITWLEGKLEALEG